MTPWMQHVQRWSNCTRCNLKHCRTSVVLGRGRVPADVLLVGEAPGESEDTLATPFVGPAGKLLDLIVSRSIPGVICCFTNIVACIPRDEEWQKVSKPAAVELQACFPRLQEIVQMCNPKMVVNVGVEAAKWMMNRRVDLKLGNVPYVDIVHPAFILRASEAQQGLEVKRSVVKIQSAWDEVQNPKKIATELLGYTVVAPTEHGIVRHPAVGQFTKDEAKQLLKRFYEVAPWSPGDVMEPWATNGKDRFTLQPEDYK